jgi:ThiF family
VTASPPRLVVDRATFEREFNWRTLAYHPEFVADQRAVVVAIGERTDGEAGHALAAALANLLSRAHRRIIFVGNLDRRFIGHEPLGAKTLREATVERALSINPFIDVAEMDAIPSEDVLISIGLGADAELRVGGRGWCALFGDDVAIDEARTTLLGVALAASLTASVTFHRQLGRKELPEGSYSLWEYGRRSEAQGPELSGPIDVGSVLQVGAGAVACALDYWLAVIGAIGAWAIVDGDVVDLSNLNRQMLFGAADAGAYGDRPQPKAMIAAKSLGPDALAEVAWGDEAESLNRRYDLVLPLANERGVRSLLQARPEPVLLHATTTPNWATVAHRHIAGLDGCIVCRIAHEHDPSFTCSTAEVGQAMKQDASLPFLSAAAGALLLGEVVRLQFSTLASRVENYGLLNLASPWPWSASYHFDCNEGCRAVPPAGVRALASRTRWASLAGPQRSRS